MMYKLATEGTDAIDAVTSPMAHAASSAARTGVTGAGIGTIAGALLSKGKLHAAGVGGVTGATLGAISGVHSSGQQRHMAMQAMGLEPKVATETPYDVYMQEIKEANALGDSIVNISRGFDEHIMTNVGRVAAGATRGAGHLAEGVASLDLQGKLRRGGQFLQDFGDKGMDRVIWGRTLTGLGAAALAYGAGREISDANRARQLYYQGQV